MPSAVRALLSGIIDYAGLFPPAKLPMEQALRNYLRYRTEPESWMLGRFICPASRLAELEAYRADITSLSAPLVISALGRGGKDAKEFLDGVRADLADIANFRSICGDKVTVDVYEAKLPRALFEAGRDHPLYATIGTTAFLIETGGATALTPFFEPPSADSSVVQRLLDSLAADRASPDAGRRQRCRPAGGKLRCGGLEPTAFPSPEQLAFALVQARDHAIPLKFTAGLHHPLRHFDAGLQCPMHGFLNVYVAGIMAAALSLNVEQTGVILKDEAAGHWAFDDALHWKEASVASSQVEEYRTSQLFSFGSCSFDEPRVDLRGLGLLT
jgi:hypothetical protein